MFPSTTATRSALAGLAALVATAVTAAPAAAAPSVAPQIVAEPTFTVGTTNVVRWQPLDGGWSENGSHDRGYLVHVENMTTGQGFDHAVGGAGADRIELESFDFPGYPNVDGIAFRYTVKARDRRCVTRLGGTCVDWGGLNAGPASDPTVSVQDATAPTGALSIEADAPITGKQQVAIGLAASDAASGPGSVQLATSDTFPDCSAVLRGCVQDYAPSLVARLAPGPDGQRRICARVFDRAAAPVGTGILRPGVGGLPPGNASGPLCDTILLDTTGPTLRVQPAPATVAVGAPLALDASASDDVAGLGADSGIDAGTAVWTFGDGTTASGLAVTHAFGRPGTTTVRLRMRDRVGNESTVDVPVVVVAAGAGQPPTGGTGPAPGGTTAPAAGAVAHRLAAVKVTRRGRQATVQFQLGRAGRVVVTIARQPAGRVVARLVRNGASGVNRVALGTRLARPGRYVVTVQLPAAGLRRSVAVRVR
jgi:hypothetical protein